MAGGSGNFRGSNLTPANLYAVTPLENYDEITLRINSAIDERYPAGEKRKGSVRGRAIDGEIETIDWIDITLENPEEMPTQEAQAVLEDPEYRLESGSKIFYDIKPLAEPEITSQTPEEELREVDLRPDFLN